MTYKPNAQSWLIIPLYTALPSLLLRRCSTVRASMKLMLQSQRAGGGGKCERTQRSARLPVGRRDREKGHGKSHGRKLPDARAFNHFNVFMPDGRGFSTSRSHLVIRGYFLSLIYYSDSDMFPNTIHKYASHILMVLESGPRILSKTIQ